MRISQRIERNMEILRKISSSGKKVVQVWRPKKDSIVKPCTAEPVVPLDDNIPVTTSVRTDISSQRKPTSSAKISGNQNNATQLPDSMSSRSNNVKSSGKPSLKHSAGLSIPPPSQTISFPPSSSAPKAASIPRRKRISFIIPFRWWFGFSRSFEDGRAGKEGRTCHVLSEIEFGGTSPRNWFSDLPLSDWGGIVLYPGSVLFDRLDICRS